MTPRDVAEHAALIASAPLPVLDPGSVFDRYGLALQAWERDVTPADVKQVLETDLAHLARDLKPRAGVCTLIPQAGRGGAGGDGCEGRGHRTGGRHVPRHGDADRHE